MDTLDDEALSKALHDEHVALSRQTARLRKLIGGEFGWSEVESAISQLEGTVHRHFEFEEKGGYLDGVLHRDPNQQEVVAKLEREHDQMRSDLDRAHDLAVEAKDRSALRELLNGWLAVMAEHEGCENRLVQTVFNFDCGEAD